MMRQSRGSRPQHGHAQSNVVTNVAPNVAPNVAASFLKPIGRGESVGQWEGSVPPTRARASALIPPFRPAVAPGASPLQASSMATVEEQSPSSQLLAPSASKSQFRSRFLVLLLCSVFMVGNYFCYDNPSALQDPLRSLFHDMDDDKFNYFFNLLYSVYSIPNTVLPFLGGYFVSRLGGRWMNVLFCTIIVAGQSLVALGASLRSFPIMLVRCRGNNDLCRSRVALLMLPPSLPAPQAGRVLFGAGGELLTVGQSTVVAEWFEGKELGAARCCPLACASAALTNPPPPPPARAPAMALGINLSIARLGSVINDFVSPRLADVSVPFAFWVGSMICFISLVCSLCVVPIDRTAERKLAEQHGVVLNRELPEEERVRLTDVKYFGLPFWLLSASCIVVYGTVLPFNNIASTFISFSYICHGRCCPASDVKNDCPAQKSATKQANNYMMIPFVISAVVSPFLGGLVDRFGYRAVATTLSALVLGGVHLSLVFLSGSVGNVAVPLVFMGIGYSIYAAAMWPSMPYIVPMKQLGTAYGLITMLQNIGLSLFPLIVAALRNSGPDYRYVSIFFACLGLLGFLVGIWMNLDDKWNRGSALNGTKPPQHNGPSTEKLLEQEATREPILGEVHSRRALVPHEDVERML